MNGLGVSLIGDTNGAARIRSAFLIEGKEGVEILCRDYKHFNVFSIHLNLNRFQDSIVIYRQRDGQTDTEHYFV